MKIAIIGKGTSSIITALICMSRGHSVEIFYDPKVPPIDVGESTTPHIGQLILRTLDLSIGHLVDEDICSYKHGAYFLDWGVGNPFKHHFENETSFHFNTIKFNNYIHNILEEGGVKYHPIRVDSSSFEKTDRKVIIDGKKYDFQISCVGWEDTDQYIPSPFETVNAGILYHKNHIEEPLYTVHRATKNGYEFELPFPKENASHCGHLFNRNLVDVDQVYQEVKQKYPECRKIQWNPRYSKRLIQNNLEAYNGNRVFFSDPLQSLSLYNYHVFVTLICNYLEDRTYDNLASINETYIKHLRAYFETLAYHYKFGSIYESEFWTDVKKRASDFLCFSPNVVDINIFKQNILVYKRTDSKVDRTWVGTFKHPSTKDIYEGMTGKSLF